jgi:hypothetical protein
MTQTTSAGPVLTPAAHRAEAGEVTAQPEAFERILPSIDDRTR